MLPSLGRRLIMRFERTGDRLGAAGKVDNYLVFDVQTGQVVVVFLGNMKAISGEDRGSFGGFLDVRPKTEVCVIAQYQRLRLSIANEGEVGLIFNDLVHVEFHRLEIPGGAGRLQTRTLEFSG